MRLACDCKYDPCIDGCRCHCHKPNPTAPSDPAQGVKRYGFFEKIAGMKVWNMGDPNPEGRFVEHSDYAKLEAELEEERKSSEQVIEIGNKYHQDFERVDAENRELKAELERVNGDLVKYMGWFDAAQQNEQVFKTRCTSMREALEKYGKHLYSCKVRSVRSRSESEAASLEIANPRSEKCDCGLAAAIAGGKQ